MPGAGVAHPIKRKRLKSPYDADRFDRGGTDGQIDAAAGLVGEFDHRGRAISCDADLLDADMYRLLRSHAAPYSPNVTPILGMLLTGPRSSTVEHPSPINGHGGDTHGDVSRVLANM